MGPRTKATLAHNSTCAILQVQNELTATNLPLPRSLALV